MAATIAQTLKNIAGIYNAKEFGARGNGTDDTTAIRNAEAAANAAGGGTLFIPDGIYLVSSPIYLHSGVHVKGTRNTVFKKSGVFSHVFVNAAAATFGSVTDSDISIEDVTIDSNNTGGLTGAAALTARGTLHFAYADKVKLKNVSIINGDTSCFGVHFQSVSNSLVENYSYVGQKDGFHINGGCHDIVINGFYIDSYDDAFGIMTDDYPNAQHNCQDIRNIIVMNGVSNDTNTPAHGYVTRFMTGSWLAWNGGNSYSIGHVARNSGNLYKMVTAGPTVASVAPTHLSGDVTGADGIQWRWVGAGTNLNSNIYNIQFINVQILDGRTITRLISNDPLYDIGEYPGTENTSTVDGVYFTNVLSTTAGSVFSINSGLIGLFGQSLIGNVVIPAVIAGISPLGLSVAGNSGFGAGGNTITIGGASALAAERVYLRYNGGTGLGELFGVGAVGIGIGGGGVSNVVTIDANGKALVKAPMLIGGLSQILAGALLEISGSVSAHPDQGLLYLNDTQSAALGIGAGITLGGKYSAANDQTYFAGIRGIKENATDANYAGALIFLTRANGGSDTERVRIDSAGNVGIGMSTLMARLGVNPNALALGLHLMKYSGDNASHPTTPTFANSYLNVGGGEYSTGTLRAITFGYHPAGDTFVNPPAYIGTIDLSTSGHMNGDMVFGTRAVTSDTLATERMRITGAGFVGIGTDAPKSALHVVGLPIYANNAAAAAGGLTAGAFYRTGADPDPVCVVH